MKEKITIYGVEQYIMGRDNTEKYYFMSKQAQEEYYNDHNNCTKVGGKTINKKNLENYLVFKTYQDWSEYFKNYI